MLHMCTVFVSRFWLFVCKVPSVFAFHLVDDLIVCHLFLYFGMHRKHVSRPETENASYMEIHRTHWHQAIHPEGVGFVPCMRGSRCSFPATLVWAAASATGKLQEHWFVIPSVPEIQYNLDSKAEIQYWGHSRKYTMWPSLFPSVWMALTLRKKKRKWSFTQHEHR